jgi:hypothetical protein
MYNTLSLHNKLEYLQRYLLFTYLHNIPFRSLVSNSELATPQFCLQQTIEKDWNTFKGFSFSSVSLIFRTRTLHIKDLWFGCDEIRDSRMNVALFMCHVHVHVSCSSFIFIFDCGRGESGLWFLIILITNSFTCRYHTTPHPAMYREFHNYYYRRPAALRN